MFFREYFEVTKNRLTITESQTNVTKMVRLFSELKLLN